jgi:hypothetical protein
LEELLKEIGIPEHAYSLKGGLPNEVFCISKYGDIWQIYYSERGIKTGLQNFKNESEACEYFFAWIKRILKK